MEIFNANKSILTEPEIDAFPLDQILPDRTGRSETVGLASPSFMPKQLPVITEIDAGDDLLPGHIQQAIAPQIYPPSPPQPPSLADPLIGNSTVVNQEAIASLGSPGHGVKVEYYDRPDFTNKVLTTIVPKIYFDWGDGSPDEGIGSDTFSARWTGKIQPPFTEPYTLYVRSDGGVRLWVDGELAIDAWSSEGSAEYSSTIALEAGQLYDFTLEYAENTGNAAIELLWSSASQPQQTIPSSALHTSETRLSPEPGTLEPLQFHTNSFYNPGDSVKFRGQVFVGDRDPDKIDFRLQKDGGEWVDISDATQLEASDDPDYAFFYYELSGLEPGQYQLQGIVIDEPQTSFTESFTVLSLPTETALPDSVLHAIGRAANLENYTAEELAATRRWIVNLPVGESSAELATVVGARDIGATGHIPNSFIWEFPADVDAIDVASQLRGLVQFAYPQVPIEVELLSTPNDPLFKKQWHLQNTRQKKGSKRDLDANVTEAWDEVTGQGVTGEGVVIAIVDDGLQHTHPDLIGNYRADLSRDFNEGDLDARNYDRDPAPFSLGLTFDAEMENSVILEEEIPTLYVPMDGNVKVENLKAILNIDNPLSPDVPVYIKSPDETTWELIQESNGSLSYVIDGEFPNDERASGEWQLEVPSGTPGVLNNWSLILDVWYPHGTPVAGIAAASGNNNLGVTGVAPDAELAGLKLIAGSEVYDVQFADALYDEISEIDRNIELNQEIDIYNNSWKLNAFDSGASSLMAMEKGVTEGRDGKGNIYVFGAGNDWKNFYDVWENVNFNSLANSRYTIAVGAIDHQGYKSAYSQEGASLLISAPSGSGQSANNPFKQGIATTDLVGGEGRNISKSERNSFGLKNEKNLDYTNDFGGTSAASPLVSGVVALMLEANPNLTWRDVQHILVETANRDKISDNQNTAQWSGTDTDEIRHSLKYGFGIVDAQAAVNAAASWMPVAEEVPFPSGTLTVEKPQILDGTPIEQTFEITEDINIEWVEVVVDISYEPGSDHITDSDEDEEVFRLSARSGLEIKLISPSGEESVLANPWFEELEADVPDDAGYDDWMLTSVRHWGESSLGEWKLRVTDTRPLWNDTVGSWNSWELKIHGTQPIVSVEATAPDASEDGNSGEFTFTRTGGKLDRPLTVNYSVEGTAAGGAGADYQALTGTAVILAGEESAIARVTPEDDAEVEGNETVVVNLVDDPSYAIGTDNSATVTIADNDNNPPTLTGISLLTGAIEGKSFTISYSELMAKSDAADADGDAIAFEISTIASGSLMKNDVPVEPGVTTLSEGEAVVWTPDTVGDEVAAFAVRAFDGTDYSEQVQVNVAVAALPVVAISATDGNASEDGDTGEFTVTRSGATTESLSVSYSTAGDANAGSDYSTIGEIVFPAGSQEVKVSLDPIDDEEIEEDETVVLNLEPGTSYKLADESSATVTIANNDFPNNPPTLTGISLLMGAIEEKSFTISYSDLMAKSDATDADGDAIAFEISTIASGTLMKNDVPIEPGVTTLSEGEAVVWTPDIVGDEVAAFGVRLFDGTDYSAQVPVFVAVAALPVVTISATDGNASEDGDSGEFTVTRTGDTTESLEVSYSTAGDATAGSDYSTIGEIVFPAGSQEVKVSLDPIDDEEIEEDETVVLNLEPGTSYKLADSSSATVTIANNDFPNNPPTLTGISLLMGAIEEKSFTISYSDLMEQSDATDADGDAIAFEISTIASGTLIKNDVPVEPGVTTLSEGEAVVWTPDIVGDEVAAFGVRAFDGTDYSEQVQVFVAVAALPVVGISATDANASEDGDSGEFTVTRTGDTTELLEVSYSTAGDAVAGTDYSDMGNILIPAGFSEVKISLDPIDDEEIEGPETVVLNLEAGSSYLLGDESSASVSIADDDRLDSLADLKIAALSNPTTVAPNGALTYTLFVINSGSAAATDIEISDTLPVEFSLLDVTSQSNFVADTSTPGIVSFTGGSIASGDFAILTISGNVSPDAVGSLTNSVVVDPDNQIPETDETNNTATATVQAIAPLPVVIISATDANASEDGDSAEFTVARSGATTESLSVSYSTAGDATAGSDYSDIGPIVFPAGSSEVTVAIDPIDDGEIEGSETVVLNLEAGTGYLLGEESSAQVSIADNATPAVIHTASYNGHTYHLLDTDGTKWWQDAEAEANSLGGHLVTINDAAENQWVLDTFGPIALTYANDNNLPDREKISLWIGLSDHLNEGTYQWSSGESNEYLNWASGEPANIATDEDFAGMLVNFGTPGKWHDISGSTRDIDLPFGVVEVENDSPPPTQENDFLLVSSFLSDEVLRYDATTGEFIDEFVSAGSGGLDGPDGLALGPDGNLYVSSQLTDQVLRYDGTTGAFLDVFASGGGLDAPIEITFGPDDNLYVSSAGTDQVLRYDGTTGAFIDVFASGGGLDGPIEITFGPDGNLYVSSFVADQAFQILRYNGTTGAFLDVFISGEGLTGINRGLTFGPDDNLYLTSSLSDYVLRYDGTTGEFIDEFVSAGSGGLDFPHDITFGPDGNVYVSSAITASVLRYDDTTGAFLDVFASGGGLDGPIDLVFVENDSPPPTQENDFLLVSSFNTDQVLRYDATTGEFIDVFASGGGLNNPDDLTLGPDGNLYVGSFGTDQVLRYDGTTGAFIDVFASGGGLNDPGVITFGPDGNLYVGSFGTDQVLRYDSTTGAFLDVFASGGGLDGPSGIIFGPDGNLYVNSLNTHRVLRYDGTTGVFLDVFASGGGLHAPNRGVTFGPDGNFYVTSSLSDEVLRYDGTTGLFIDEFVPAGSGGLDFPNDLTFGPEGNLYVSSVVTKSVLRYDGTTGAFLDVFASDGGLSGPVGLVFTPSELAEPFPHSQKIVAQDIANDDNFGQSLALDGNNLLIGSSGDDDKGTWSGSTYLLDISTGQQLHKLTAPDGFQYDNFGWAVDIDGDYLLSSAPGDDDNGVNSGSVYLFNTNGEFIRKIIAPDGATQDKFGHALAIDGNHALIGSTWDSDKGTYSGSAYLFDLTNGKQLHKFIAPDGVSREEFGYSVALHGDYALIGLYADNNWEENGSAYLFNINSGELLKKFTAPDGARYDNFGRSVALKGNYALIGSEGDDDNGKDSGSAYLFDLSSYEMLHKFMAPDGANGDLFGHSVKFDGNNVLIGASNDDDRGENSGSTYLFNKDGKFLRKFLAADGASEDLFGHSLAIDGDSVVISSHKNDAYGSSSGAAYLYTQAAPTGEFILPTPPDSEEEPTELYPLSPKIIALDGASSEEFGSAVAIDGNYGLIGSYKDSDKGSESGSASLFDATTGELLQKFLAPDGIEYDFFGFSVAVDSNRALIGSPGDNDNGSRSGSAFVFDVTNGNFIRKFLAPDGASQDQFGSSLALNGNHALIGSKWDEDNGSFSGSAYLFNITTGEMLKKFLAPDGASNDEFGYSVAIDGNYALISSHLDDDKGKDSGSAYLFDITTGNLLRKIIPSDNASDDRFGYSLAVNGNYGLIGAVGDDDKGSFSGSAYLFNITTGEMLKKFIAPDGASGDAFGSSVAIAGNYGLIGAFRDDDKGENSGSAYLFDISSGEFLQQFTAPDGASEDEFGHAVAIDGTQVLIGAHFDDVKGNDSGSAYLFAIE